MIRNLAIAGFIAAPVYVACRAFVAWASEYEEDDGEWPFDDEDEEGVISV